MGLKEELCVLCMPANKPDSLLVVVTLKVNLDISPVDDVWHCLLLDRFHTCDFVAQLYRATN